MGVPVLSDEDWKRLRDLSIKGIPDAKLSQEFGVRVGTIIQRRCNDAEWLTLWRTGINRKGRPNLSFNDKATESASLINASLEELSSENPLLLANYVHGKIKEAVQTDSLPAPSSWAELKTANEIFRKTVGLDKDQAPVQINLWGSNQDGVSVNPPIDITENERGTWV